jgi:hypothetical protein
MVSPGMTFVTVWPGAYEVTTTGGRVLTSVAVSVSYSVVAVMVSVRVVGTPLMVVM